MRVLDRLGVYDEVRAHGFVHDFVSLVNIQGDLVGKIVLGSQELYGYPAVRLYRNSLRQVLLAEACRQGIEVRHGMRCVKVEESDEAATVMFENGEAEAVTADLVIGTDGMYSCTRGHVAPGRVPAFTGQIAVIAFAKKAGTEALEAIRNTKFILGSEGSFAMMPADRKGDEVMFFSTIETHERTKEEWKDFNADKQGLKGLLLHPFSHGEWPGVVRKLVQDTPVETFFCWP